MPVLPWGHLISNPFLAASTAGVKILLWWVEQYFSVCLQQLRKSNDTITTSHRLLSLATRKWHLDTHTDAWFIPKHIKTETKHLWHDPIWKIRVIRNYTYKFIALLSSFLTYCKICLKMEGGDNEKEVARARGSTVQLSILHFFEGWKICAPFLFA